MKTESEFNDWLKKRLRHGRKGFWPIRVARGMGMAPGVYFAYEKGDLPLTVYQLYRFMHVTGRDTEFIKQILDDDWHPSPQPTPMPKEETSELCTLKTEN